MTSRVFTQNCVAWRCSPAVLHARSPECQEGKTLSSKTCNNELIELCTQRQNVAVNIYDDTGVQCTSLNS